MRKFNRLIRLAQETMDESWTEEDKAKWNTEDEEYLNRIDKYLEVNDEKIITILSEALQKIYPSDWRLDYEWEARKYLETFAETFYTGAEDFWK